MGKLVLIYVLFLVNLCVAASQKYEKLKIINNQPLKVYWNVPSFQCEPFKLNFTPMLDKYNIIHNVDSQFRGETITILYDPGDFPALLTTTANGTFYRNGGVPQEGNLTLHLEVLQESITAQIPNENYSGLAIIDFESWRPIFRQHWGSISLYKDVSIDIERQKHPTWNDNLLTKEATRRLEEAGRTFMEESLNLAKELRPNGLWGYYHYPYSYTNGSEESVSKQVQIENDRISWLWKDSDVFYPSVYMRTTQSLEHQIKFVETTLDEVFRIKKSFNTEAKVYVYVTYMYIDTKTYIPQEYMRAILTAVAGYDIEGVILWGASNDVSGISKCKLLYNYIDNVFGPTVMIV
ncbi:hyaluronidase Tab y 2.0101-like isoform X2 [Anthonomus grandis grandis]|uniref:hyaluronidase Tab y 2.0101-like isoform X2 n=1 Tax=Anthonomus grandis grandis TaxID=2921223 RepID=UPI002165ACD3|nr:hyaluronidase Tab y 2.0101-like isoform X2 [Anthonomus grandis grandis]